MDKNVLDIATDILKTDLNDIKTFIHNDLKGTRQYRKEPVPLKERVRRYTEIPAEQLEIGRKYMPDEMAKYEEKMQKDIRRFQNGGL